MLKTSFYKHVINTVPQRNRHLKPVTNMPVDRVSFSGKTSLLEKYRINPDDVTINKTENVENIDNKTKKELLERILEAHEHASKNYYSGNIAKAGYATNIGLSNGVWECATNFNNTRNQISAVCGERSGVLMAYNSFLGKLSLDKLKKGEEKTQKDFKIKYLAMSSFKEPGTDKYAGSPCADCLSWLNTERFFDDNTIIASLMKDKKGNFSLELRTVKDSLALRKEMPTTINDKQQIPDLSFDKTTNAKSVMKDKNITEKQIQDVLLSAKAAFDANECSEFSGQNIASAVKTSAGEITSAKKN